MGKDKEPPKFYFEYYTDEQYQDAINGARRWFAKTYGTQTLGDKHMDDFIHEAFKRLAEGKRKWEPDKYKLVWILAYIIRGTVSNEYLTKKKMIELEDDQLKFLLAASDASRPRSPDYGFECNQILSFVKTRVIASEDELLIKLFMCIYYRQSHDEGDNNSLSEALDITLSELLNVKKRLKRLINSLKKEVAV